LSCSHYGEYISDDEVRNIHKTYETEREKLSAPVVVVLFCKAMRKKYAILILQKCWQEEEIREQAF